MEMGRSLFGMQLPDAGLKGGGATSLGSAFLHYHAL